MADLLRLLGPLTEAEIAERSHGHRRRRLAGRPAGRQTRAAGVVSPASRGGWPSRTSAGCATGSGSPFRSACRRASPRSVARSARRAARPVRPHPRAVHHRRGRRPVRAGSAGDRRRAGPNGVRRQAGSRRVRRPHRRCRTSGATPRCCGSCADARWPRCAPRSNRSAPPPTPGSCPRGSRSAARPRPGSTVWPVSSTSSPACRSRPRRSNRWCSRQRVRDYQPAMLDELLASGEVTWSGAGSISGSDGWIAFHPADTAPLTLAAPAEIEFTDAHRAIFDVLGSPGEPRRVLLPPARRRVRRRTAKTALWELIWAGWITGDTFAPVRAMLSGGRRPGTRRPAAPAHRQRRAPRLSRYRVAHAADPAGRPDGRRTLVGAAGRRAGFDCARALLRGAAAEPLRRADQGCGRSRRSARRVRDAVQGAHRDSRTPGAASAATSSNRSAARSSRWPRPSTGCAPTSTASTRSARTTTRSCWPPPTPPTPTARRCRGPREQMPTPATGPAARPVRWSCWSTASWCGSSNAADGRC